MNADIIEVFSSIQGEGLFVGAKQIFVRFKKCNLRCSFCDVPGFAPAEEYEVEKLMERIGSLESSMGPHHSVSLTGGEPLLYAEFLGALIARLKERGFKVYLETNGTLPEKLSPLIDSIDIVAMDFKLPSATHGKDWWREHEEFLRIASKKKVFVKIVVTGDTKEEDIEKAAALIKAVDGKIPLIVQPVHAEEGAGEAVTSARLLALLEIASRHALGNVRVIPQVHKMLGVR